MQQSMAYWGPDGSQLWQSGSLGLGYLALHTTPESVFETQPRISGDSSLILTSSARLDNRQDLCSLLNIPTRLMPETPESVFILRAYEKWGQACVNHLLGDWAFAIWDERRQELFIARDHNGVSGMYYYADAKFFAFASSIKGLLALREIPRRLNEPRLAQILVIYPDSQGNNNAQLYKDIQILPPAHSLKVTTDGLNITEYWRLEDTPKTRFGSDEEYVEAFLERYDEAVRSRLRSFRKIGVSLSGGLDSTSVLAIAGQAANNDNRRLTAFTSIPIYKAQESIHRSRIGDEWSLAHSAVKKVKNVDHKPIYAKDISPLQGIQRFLDLHEQASFAAVNYYWMFALYSCAQQNGLGVVLDGQRGNATVSWSGGSFPAMTEFRSRNFSAGWKEFQDWKAAHQISWIRAVKRQLINPLLPYFRNFRTLLPLQKEPWVSYSAIHPNFARRLNILPCVRLGQKQSAARNVSEPEVGHYAIYNVGRTWIGAIAHGSGAGYDLEIRDPTIDQRVLKFCFSIPNNQFRRAGEDRWLIRRAMQGLLPEQVLSNPQRGLQAADVALRTAAHPEEMESTFRRFERSCMVGDYLDLQKMRQVWDSVQSSVNAKNTFQCANILLRGILAGLFLLRFYDEEND